MQAGIRSGGAVVHAVRFLTPIDHAFKAAERNHAAACVVRWLGSESKKLRMLMLRRQSKGDWQMLNEIIATALLIVLAWFAAGSSQLADERSQIKRGNKWAKDNYPPTY
jgi:hypothetical protein